MQCCVCLGRRRCASHSHQAYPCMSVGPPRPRDPGLHSLDMSKKLSCSDLEAVSTVYRPLIIWARYGGSASTNQTFDHCLDPTLTSVFKVWRMAIRAILNGGSHMRIHQTVTSSFDPGDVTVGESLIVGSPVFQVLCPLSTPFDSLRQRCPNVTQIHIQEVHILSSSTQTTLLASHDRARTIPDQA